MEPIGLQEAIAVLRSELSEAIEQANEEVIQFPIGSVQLQFQVGVTRDESVEGKLRFWVVDFGSKYGHQSESVHIVTVTLGAPLDRDGQPIKISRHSSIKP